MRILFSIIFVFLIMSGFANAEEYWENPPPDICPEYSATPVFLVKSVVECNGSTSFVIEDITGIYLDGCSTWATDHWVLDECSVSQTVEHYYPHWEGMLDGQPVVCVRHNTTVSFECVAPDAGCGPLPSCAPGQIIYVSPYGCGCVCVSINQWCTEYVAFPDGYTFTVKCNYVGGGYRTIDNMGIIYGCDEEWNCPHEDSNRYAFVYDGFVDTQLYDEGNYTLYYPWVFLYCYEPVSTIEFNFQGTRAFRPDYVTTYQGRGMSPVKEIHRKNKRVAGHGGYEKRIE